ncbi:uncharacterized protein K460DRAFT_397340 [Cucurbitaria berberidis CBS 394.84]|uniref:Uncharacterized protein n=1 Tax=Cucurbitaria berberidis CBS 394.84 TaxID=1168544 RepID=A0A9P4GEM1_9PLEO|nr:uncharacterized protein K460DRAFT_397340 [Cucurbitaria berberidis CBS 394.84]KAF1844202.1 hypothetical protein K460DRAFT_397340 [Cucurbitaria berberidis CBS 394.84]
MVKLNDITTAYRTQAWSYLPCAPVSKTHDLNCGHRVQTAAAEPCGSNCSNPMHPVSTPFICHICIAQPILEGLGIKPYASTDEIWYPTKLDDELATGIASALVEEEVCSLTDQGQRDTAPVLKTDGLAEFVREYGTKVLEIGERELLAVENMFRGMEIKSKEEKMETMEHVFAALGLAESGVGTEQEDAVKWFC